MEVNQIVKDLMNKIEELQRVPHDKEENIKSGIDFLKESVKFLLDYKK